LSTEEPNPPPRNRECPRPLPASPTAVSLSKTPKPVKTEENAATATRGARRRAAAL